MEGNVEGQSFSSPGDASVLGQHSESSEITPSAVEKSTSDIACDVTTVSSHLTPATSMQSVPLNPDPNVDTRGPPPLSRQLLTDRAQQLIDRINEKRKRDTALLDDFRKAMHHRVELSCDLLEQRIYSVYEASGRSIQPRLQELFSTLDRVAAIEDELDNFRQGLGVLYKDITHAQS